MLFKTTEFIAVDNAENANAALDDDEIIQEVLRCKSAENDSDTENENTNASIEKFSLNEGEDALKKSLIFLKQQENIEFKTEDLTVIWHLINQIELHRLSLLKQPSINYYYKFLIIILSFQIIKLCYH